MNIKLWDNVIPMYKDGFDTPNTMDAYFIDTKEPIPAIIVFPGGGYSIRAKHEGEPVARFYNSRGFHSFVVNYRVKPYGYPCALMDAQRAIKLVRYHAKEWKIDPNRIFTIGFSAGGHLSGCTATMKDISKIGDELDDISARPTGAMMGYPLISSYEEDGAKTSHCIESILVNNADVKKEDISLQNCVTDETVPCFIWHTADDDVVPISHTLKFADQLAKHSIPFEVHIFPHGRHGLGLAEDHPDVRKWADLSADWILLNFK